MSVDVPDESSTAPQGPDRVVGGDATPAPRSAPLRSDTLFIGVRATCETAARLTSSDGAAVAVFTPHFGMRELVHATDALSQEIDELQFVIGEGPCLAAYQLNHPQLHPNLSDDDAAARRWPMFAGALLELGVHAVFAFPVPGAVGPLAVLELYRRRPGVFTEYEQRSALTCAAAIGSTLDANWRIQLSTASGPEEAINESALAASDPSRTVDPFARSQVHVAAGMMAVQLGINTTDALDRLRAFSFSNKQPITKVAADVIERRLSFREQPDDPKER